MKKISAYEIALSAIACALSAMALTAGTLIPGLRFTGYLVASFALMLPLTKKCWWGDVLAYVGASLLSLLFTGFRIFDILPFLVFFGLHPLVNALLSRSGAHRRGVRVLAKALKAVWFDAAMYLVWRFVFGMNTSFNFVDEYIIPVILVGGTIFFLAYDYLFSVCQKATDCLVGRFFGKK